MPALNSKPPATLPPRKVAVIYDDEPASQRAARVLADLAAASRTPVPLLPVAWSIDALNHLVCRCRAYGDVIPADLVVLVISRSDRVPATVNRWLAACLEAKRHRSTTLFVAVDSGDVWTFSLEGASAPAVRPTHAASTRCDATDSALRPRSANTLCAPSRARCASPFTCRSAAE